MPPPTDVAILGESQEPPCLNVYVTACALDSTRLATTPVLAGAYRVRPDFSYEPMLVDRVTVGSSPFTLTYHLRDDAKWSDGVPVTADDLVFTFATLRDPANDIASRIGYDRIAQATAIDAKTARFVFDRPYSAWKSLFPQVLPRHVLEGMDFDTFWNAGIVDRARLAPFGSGPFLITEWLSGTQITLTPNPEWWGATSSLDALVLRFIPSPSAQVQALLAGELTAIHPPPSQALVSLQGVGGIAFGSSPGTLVEHLDVNVASTSMPLLGESWFRQAIAYALDRDAAITAGWGALAPGMEPRDSLVHLSQQPEYRPVFDRYGLDPASVSRIMRRNRCSLAPDGIWSCAGTRASVRFATTSGNTMRLAFQERLVLKARAAGIELVPDNSPSGELFGTRLPNRDYELIMFAWPLGGEPTFGLGRLYGCDGASNVMAYCSQRVTELFEAADESVASPTARLHRADAILADDVVSMPLFQHPLFLAHRTTLVGIQTNAGPQGLTWNVEEWRLE